MIGRYISSLLFPALMAMESDFVLKIKEKLEVSKYS